MPTNTDRTTPITNSDEERCSALISDARTQDWISALALVPDTDTGTGTSWTCTLQSQPFCLGSLLSGVSVRSSFDMHKNVRQFVLAVIKWSCDFIAYLIACKSPQMQLHRRMLNSNAFTVAMRVLSNHPTYFRLFPYLFVFVLFFTLCFFSFERVNTFRISESYQFSHRIRRNPFEVTQTPFLTQSDPIDSKVIYLVIYHTYIHKIIRCVASTFHYHSIPWRELAM